MNRTQYTIVAIDGTEDARAAAAACNKALGDAGDSFSLEAAEAQFAECSPSLRDALAIEGTEIEIWEAWIDGDRDNAERFSVPAGGMVDIAEAGAAALGVEVSESLNVVRV